MPTNDSPMANLKTKVSEDYIIEENSKYVETLAREKPELIRDILPNFQPLLFMIVIHVVYIFFGNAVIVAWLAYMFRPYFNPSGLNDDSYNVSKKHEKNFYTWPFRLAIYLYLVVYVISLIYNLLLFSTWYRLPADHWLMQNQPSTPIQMFMFNEVMGHFGSVSFIAGHELIHYKDAFNKYFGLIPLWLGLYSHYFDEHVKGHHKNVGTLEDPAFPPFGRNVYQQFYYGTTGTHISHWNREVDRITRKSHGPVSMFTIVAQNGMTHYFIAHVMLLMGVYQIFGGGGLAWFLSQAFYKVFHLIVGDYAEHYGLQRQKDEKSGVYESISLQHSWNDGSSPMLFRVQRHSDHHQHAYRPYQLLRRYDLAPSLPFCYIDMSVTVMTPSWFFMMMDPRVKAIQDAKAGIPNKDQWNDVQPLSEADKQRFVIHHSNMRKFLIFFTIMAFVPWTNAGVKYELMFYELIRNLGSELIKKIGL